MTIYRHTKRWTPLLLLLATAMLGIVSCDEPGAPPQTEHGKRNYSWTYDTISHEQSFQTNMQAIWGSSDTDAYIVGENSRGTIGAMYHYNGKLWSSVHLHTSEGGLINVGLDLHAIYGFGSKDIYAVGAKSVTNPHPPPNILDSSIIIHFDGSAWREVPIERGGTLLTVYGTSPTDLWAGGNRGTLYHYSGGQWKKSDLGTTKFVCSFAGYSSADLYTVVGNNLAGPDIFGDWRLYFQHWDGLRWTIFDSTNTTDNVMKFGETLWMSSYPTLYSATWGAYRYMPSKGWSNILKFTNPSVIGGSSNENIYVVGVHWMIHHWNGVDWTVIATPLTGSGGFNGVWSDNHTTFIIGTDGNRTYVMHGK